MKALEYDKQLLKEQAEADQHSLDRMKVREALQQYDSLRDSLLKDIEHRDLREHQRNYADVQSWIAASSPLYDHEQACAKRKEEYQSGEWLLQKSPVIDWKDSDTPDSSLLWLNGIPGAGKSFFQSSELPNRSNSFRGRSQARQYWLQRSSKHADSVKSVKTQRKPFSSTVFKKTLQRIPLHPSSNRYSAKPCPSHETLYSHFATNDTKRARRLPCSHKSLQCPCWNPV